MFCSMMLIVPPLTIEKCMDDTGIGKNRQQDEFTKLYIPMDENDI